MELNKSKVDYLKPILLSLEKTWNAEEPFNLEMLIELAKSAIFEEVFMNESLTDYLLSTEGPLVYCDFDPLWGTGSVTAKGRGFNGLGVILEDIRRELAALYKEIGSNAVSLLEELESSMKRELTI